MFIHLGDDILIKSNEVIAIFDYNLVEENETNRLFIDRCLEEKKLIDVGDKSTKSIIITSQYIYFSPFSPATLKKRSQSNFN
jgi:extracellular matrix regulatory protein B